MAAKKKFKKQIRKERPLSTKCLFCEAKKDPDYKNYADLSKYLSDRGRIFSRERSGVCSKHQRKLASEVKRARFLALLPY
ncbi:MAG: 30S ribosomal protein S18 [Candidatus Woesebacteria bacterium GW2011_GWA1_33_30]|uniref:Small ribosomal subunit protein bS18 n=1 Tax=Candidatus Woesebacteria bacterium GW2011_GWA2_33_28 TaxID=1618561 RepID=A0A0G0C9Y8_9BACT|nr:MAG: 30S ribosomal protein S18 [Candidatus Woesebacteria bacterium GW2011_GWA2_33_28]KKP48813.1 MAG: 30S ribosomal protein S18 [Candidatus Woesebacteria bacterium GW2011_GWA1_33_30]KKP50086.1 MAG: 30S ribosomal protein S18 [Microgenomates group bacterium GW2011_GWC1_33_32]KKP51857.1 MAG: 30S ribosomal protein S18 [Candidatus Woesebacteria bacterium GW2011_GWB1_33_38]KKP57684.1 MAG: 30S ribosomal protein S18 [Microgenomates group bacterium GW2011_GWD1_33_9]